MHVNHVPLVTQRCMSKGMGASFCMQDVAEFTTTCERYVGTESGGMDQAISMMGMPQIAKLIEFHPVSLPLTGTERVKLSGIWPATTGLPCLRAELLIERLCCVCLMSISQSSLNFATADQVLTYAQKVHLLTVRFGKAGLLLR